MYNNLVFDKLAIKNVSQQEIPTTQARQSNNSSDFSSALLVRLAMFRCAK